jgi:phosphate-selective porin
LDSNAGGLTSHTVKPGTFSFGIPGTLTTGSFANSYSNRGGLEFAWQNGRYGARSELFASSFSEGEHLYGAYVELSYFLTDDFRTYNLKSGIFDGVKIKRNFHPFKSGEWNLVDSFGAWQAVFQWGYTDMEDWRTTLTTGGHQNDFVAGLNWFWTPQLRWVFEYVHSEQCVGTAYRHQSQDIFATSLRVHW